MSRSVLVTGGNRGIGRAVAETFRDEGDRVAITYRKEDPAIPGVLAVRCDVTDSEQVDAAFDEVEARHGNVEVLVANAGVTADNLLADMSDEQFRHVYETNVAGTFYVARRAGTAPMPDGGRIIAISSAIAPYGAYGQANYASSKAGQIGLVKSLMRELAPRGITVNAVLPGPVQTDMYDELSEEAKAGHLRSIPLGRCGQPEEIAGVVAFLASSKAAFINGVALPVDGGALGHLI
ncbi:3-oxoacyl-ACP reductase FabG [Streptomyces sp. NPDC048248]|uniref:3-oxoacyl-ACP reductase FabG n=1 Tax=Streptomyces sp. NPDC048248 TaxID=3365523 RepID=UPI003722D046